MLQQKLINARLNYQELEKIDPKEWIIINSNVIYWLMSHYQRMLGKNKDAIARECLQILHRHIQDLEVLRYYGINEDDASCMFHHMKVEDAKTILRPVQNDDDFFNSGIKIMKDIFPIPYTANDMERLRKEYLEAKRKEQKYVETEKELKYRIERGYIV